MNAMLLERREMLNAFFLLTFPIGLWR